MKVQKGEFGYIRAQKKKRTALTVILFAIPLLIFFTGLYITETRLNLFTFVAVMGCLPASRCAVGMVMMLIQKPMDAEQYREIEKLAGSLTAAYELVISAYEKNTPVDAVVVHQGNVVGFTSSSKADLPFAEKHIKEILKKNGYTVNVKIFDNIKKFSDRISSFHHEETHQENEQNSKDEIIKQTILAISL